MPSNYEAIRKDNKRRYGEEIGRIGQMLLSDRYADRTHFIFELLQNAEDALAKRETEPISRSVKFQLLKDALVIAHYGKPFDEQDVRGICGIDESTKTGKLTAIGRFGIGFKSVYAFTDSPEVYSGDEHFAIDEYVWPREIPKIGPDNESTIIRLPFKPGLVGAMLDVQNGLKHLGPRTLLFLTEIEEVLWEVPGSGHTGHYLREKHALEIGMDKITVIGEDYHGSAIEEDWIVFSREVSHNGIRMGKVEIACALNENNNGRTLIQPVVNSTIVVFFPTILPTYFGFLIQGPYRTTPSRDNIPEDDSWNRKLIEETAQLLVEAMHKLRDHDLLSVSALRCLPLDSTRFSTNNRFAPIFSKVSDALMNEPLLPRYQGGHIAALEARIAGSQEIRNLFTPEQLAHLLGSQHQIAWLSEEITADRTPDLRKYLIENLGVKEIMPDDLLSMLTKDFLEAQPDEWIEKLYVFLQGQQSLLKRSHKKIEGIPLVRIEGGIQVVPFVDSRPQAYLPGGLHTDFPTVPLGCVSNAEAWEFLLALGLNIPDPVDDIITNVIPKYRKEKIDVLETEYQIDIEQILAAFETDSREKRQQLINELKDAKILLSVDCTGTRKFVSPSQTYQATQHLKDLFSDVPGVWIVDDSKEYLRRGVTRRLLIALGTPEYLALEPIDTVLDTEQKLELRAHTGDSELTHDIRVDDYTLQNLNSLLSIIADLSFTEASIKTRLLWEALCDFQANHGTGAFDAYYHWFRYSERKARFNASFITTLNNTKWIPASNEQLSLPGAVTFEETGWRENHVLTSMITFKPRMMDELAKEAGFEPGALDFLKELGLTSLAGLEERLGVAANTNDNDPLVEQAESNKEDSADETNSHMAGATSSESAQNANGTKTIHHLKIHRNLLTL